MNSNEDVKTRLESLHTDKRSKKDLKGFVLKTESENAALERESNELTARLKKLDTRFVLFEKENCKLDYEKEVLVQQNVILNKQVSESVFKLDKQQEKYAKLEKYVSLLECKLQEKNAEPTSLRDQSDDATICSQRLLCETTQEYDSPNTHATGLESKISQTSLDDISISTEIGSAESLIRLDNYHRRTGGSCRLMSDAIQELCEQAWEACQEKQYEDAITLSSKVIAIEKIFRGHKPVLETLRGILGNACFWLERYDEAVEVYTELVDDDPEYSDFYYWRGCAYMHLKKLDEAFRDLKRVLELNPDDDWARRLLTNLGGT